MADADAAAVLRELARDPALVARIGILARTRLSAAAAKAVEQYGWRPEPTTEQRHADLDTWLRTGIPPVWHR